MFFGRMKVKSRIGERGVEWRVGRGVGGGSMGKGGGGGCEQGNQAHVCSARY